MFVIRPGQGAGGGRARAREKEFTASSATTTRAVRHAERGPRCAAAAAVLAALLMAGCGGGVDYGAPLPPVPPPVVNSAVAGPVKYSQTLVIAVDGFNLSGSLSASSSVSETGSVSFCASASA